MAIFASCEKDGDLITVFGLESAKLLASETSVVLEKATAASSVLALTWNNSSLSISDTSKGIPSSLPGVLVEVSASQDFSTTITQLTPTSNSYTFVGAALNAIGKNLGLIPGTSTPLYFRIRKALGENTTPTYSDVATVNVTCYSIDMATGLILGSKKDTTGFILYAPKSDGEYAGFTGCGAWFNWFLQEGDGTVWGNDNDGTNGTAFALSSASTTWNFWYPGQSGCYYTTLSTTKKEWTATYIPALTVSGGVTGTMTFDKATIKWTISFTTTTDNASLKVSGTGSLYNLSTGTTDASAVAKTIGFIANSDSTLSFEWNNASATDINVAKAGDYTLTFNLADPKKWTYQLKSGKTVVTKPLSKKLFLPGVDDGATGAGWNFNNYLDLVSETDSTYAGIVSVNSLWGFQMSIDSANWADVYQMGATDGTLKFKSGTNIKMPSAGVYFIKVDLKHLTYSYTAITSLSFAGLNALDGDPWPMTAMSETSVQGVYASSVTINKVSAWGCKLYGNSSWDYPYGGSNGVLYNNGSGITDDATIGVGTYDFITDFRNTPSYVFLGNEIYIGGIDDKWNFTSYVLTKSTTGVYTGTVTVNTIPWGLKIYLTKDNWTRYYGGSMNSLVYQGGNITDVTSVSAGKYTVTVDFIHKTCSFTSAR
jgi:hypothetical protein